MIEFTPSHLNRIDTQRLANYRTNLDFYQGNHWPTTSRHRQLVFNYAKVSIDKVTSFLMHGLNFACYPGEATDELKARARRAEQVLRQVYEENNLQQLDYETEIDAAVLGDGCYKVIWDTDEKRIRITAPDVSGIYAWWLGDDTSRVWRVASRYTLTREEMEMLYSGVIASGARQSRYPHQRRPGAPRCRRGHRRALRDQPGEIQSRSHPDRLRQTKGNLYSASGALCPMTNHWECLAVLFWGVQMNLDDEEYRRFLAKSMLSSTRFFGSG
jgi:hypothetical protein